MGNNGYKRYLREKRNAIFNAYVKFDYEVKTIEIKEITTVKEVKNKINQIYYLKKDKNFINNIQIYYNDKLLENNNHTMEDYGLTRSTEPYRLRAKCSSENLIKIKVKYNNNSENDKNIKNYKNHGESPEEYLSKIESPLIKINYINNANNDPWYKDFLKILNTKIIYMKENEKINDIRNILKQKFNIIGKEYFDIYKGDQLLDDDKTIKFYDINNSDILTINSSRKDKFLVIFSGMSQEVGKYVSNSDKIWDIYSSIEKYFYENSYKGDRNAGYELIYQNISISKENTFGDYEFKEVNYIVVSLRFMTG